LSRERPDRLLADLLQPLEQAELLLGEKPVGLEHRVEPGHGRLRSDRCHSGLLSLVLPAIGDGISPHILRLARWLGYVSVAITCTARRSAPDTAAGVGGSRSGRTGASVTILVCRFLTHPRCHRTHPSGRSRAATCTGSSTRSAPRSTSTGCFAPS